MLTNDENEVLNDPICLNVLKELYKYPKRSRTLKFNLNLNKTFTIHKRLKFMEDMGFVEHKHNKSHKTEFLWYLTILCEELYDIFLNL